MTAVSGLPNVIHNMVNLSRVKISLKNADFKNFRNVLDALGNSTCRLEEFEFFWNISYLIRSASGNSALLVNMMELGDLQVWTKLDRTALQKLSIRVKTNTNLITTSHQSIQANWVGDMLSDTPKLTHLNLTIQHITLNVNILDCTWPYLENLTIGDSTIFSQTASQPSSTFTDFCKRHPKLTTLSLPYFVYPLSPSPLITVECLPQLESFSYDGPLGVPLSQVLSPASAKRLRHLTIYDNTVPLKHPNNMDIYKELTSLQTFRITLDPLANANRNMDE